jgi:hypothetical protein
MRYIYHYSALINKNGSQIVNSGLYTARVKINEELYSDLINSIATDYNVDRSQVCITSFSFLHEE